MPVSGPDLTAAREQGRTYGLLLYDKMHNDRHFVGAIEGSFNYEKRIKEWNLAKEAFVASVGELFVLDAANSW